MIPQMRAKAAKPGGRTSIFLDNPSLELLARHHATLKRLLRFGQCISLSTAYPDFPDKQLAEIVAATLKCFEDKLLMWHGPKISQENPIGFWRRAFPMSPDLERLLNAL